jgi:hypothetical protein
LISRRLLQQVLPPAANERGAGRKQVKNVRFRDYSATAQNTAASSEIE